MNAHLREPSAADMPVPPHGPARDRDARNRVEKPSAASMRVARWRARWRATFKKVRARDDIETAEVTAKAPECGTKNWARKRDRFSVPRNSARLQKWSHFRDRVCA